MSSFQQDCLWPCFSNFLSLGDRSEIIYDTDPLRISDINTRYVSRTTTTSSQTNTLNVITRNYPTIAIAVVADACTWYNSHIQSTKYSIEWSKLLKAPSLWVVPLLPPSLLRYHFMSGIESNTNGNSVQIKRIHD